MFGFIVVRVTMYVCYVRNLRWNRWQLRVPENTGSAARAPMGCVVCPMPPVCNFNFNFKSKMRKMLNTLTSLFLSLTLTSLTSQLSAPSSHSNLTLTDVHHYLRYHTLTYFQACTKIIHIIHSSTIAAASCTSCSFSRR